ncbi:MAG: FHA domain-containing protein [Planctomycetota bacterium]
MKDAPRFSEAPTEKRSRPAVDLWKDDYTPPAVAAQEPPSTDEGGGRSTRRSMAAEAEAYQPPRRAGRGSSGDPSEIAPMTPSARPRPKSGETAAMRDKSLGSGSHSLPGRGKPPVEPAVPNSQLLEPRRRPPTSQISQPSAPPSDPNLPPPAAAAPAEAPASNVVDAVQAANDAAKQRKALDKTELAQYAGSLDFDAPGGGAPAEVPSAKASLSDTTANEDPDAAAQAQAAVAARAKPLPPEAGAAAGGPHMPHYLVTQVLGEPVALSRSQTIRIGRGEDNEVIFPLSQVSRHHAEVRFDQNAGAFVLIDKNSINGTFVNGKAIKRRRLADGDRIGIGPFMIVYRASTGGHRLRALDETDVIKPGSLAGELSDMPIPDVARFIEALRKTGELTVIGTGGDRGIVLFRDGQPVHAEFKVSLGSTAAVAIFRLKQGNFRFAVKAIEIPKATIAQPLSTLLTEAANPVS